MAGGSRGDLEARNRVLEKHDRRPVIDSFAEAARAYEHIGRGSRFGKVAISHQHRL